MSVQTQIDRITNAVANAHEKVAEKGGTTAQPYLVENLTSAIDTIPTGGIDTSDATAAADDIVQGETAYVDGEKISGANPYAKAATDAEVNEQTTLLDDLAGVIDSLPEAGGGLPDGISSLASGTVTIAQDSTYEMVTHNLGVIPDFIAWMLQDELAEDAVSTAVCGASFCKSIGTFIVQYLVRGCGTSGSAAGTTGSTADTEYMTTTQARMVAHSNYKLVSGKTYRWICGVMDDVL